MQAKHTPGPWHRNIRAGGKYPVVFAGRNQHVAKVEQQATAEETEANIDLIAAAPATAEKAMAFTLLVESFLRDDTGAEPVSESQLADAMYALRAHIVKATGA